MVQCWPQAKLQNPTRKITKAIKGLAHGSSGRGLPSKYEALSSTNTKQNQTIKTKLVKGDYEMPN
jgi:hypothetical protein